MGSNNDIIVTLTL